MTRMMGLILAALPLKVRPKKDIVGSDKEPDLFCAKVGYGALTQPLVATRESASAGICNPSVSLRSN
jgi:hypothetical protein